MTNIHELLAEYESIAPHTRGKGLYFERLVKRYLETEPVYAGLFDDVWLWQDWPGRDGKADNGIDLVAREKYNGDFALIPPSGVDPHRTPLPMPRKSPIQRDLARRRQALAAGLAG